MIERRIARAASTPGSMLEEELLTLVLDALACIVEWQERAGRAVRERDQARDAQRNLRMAADGFISTMGMRNSPRYGRMVPSGFSAASNDAAVELFDALAALGGAAEDKDGAA